MAGLTVTAGNGSGSGVGAVLAVDVLNGAAPRDSHPTHQFETEANTHPPGGSALFNAVGTGSWLYAVAEYGPATSPGGTTTGTRVLGFSNASIGAGLYRNTGGTTAGSSAGVAIGDTTPTCVAGEFIVAEILKPAGATLSLDGSTPTPVSGATATLTTAAFQPPAGALLVAFFGSYDGGSGVIQPVISDAWKLQWRQLSVRNTAGNGVAAIYVAQVPTAPPPLLIPAPDWFPGAPGMPGGSPFSLVPQAVVGAVLGAPSTNAPADVAQAAASAPGPSVTIAAEPAAAQPTAAAPAATALISAEPPAATAAAVAESPSTAVAAKPAAASPAAAANTPAALVAPSAGPATAAAAAEPPAARVSPNAGAASPAAAAPAPAAAIAPAPPAATAAASAPQPGAHVFANAGVAAAAASAGAVTADTTTQTHAPAGLATATAAAPAPSVQLAAEPATATAAATAPAPSARVFAHAGLAAAAASAGDVTLRPPRPTIATGHATAGTLEPRPAGIATAGRGPSGVAATAEPAAAGIAGTKG